MQISLVDVEKLARGESIAHESFLAILLSPTALARVSAVHDMQQMFEPAAQSTAALAEGSSDPASGAGLNAERSAELSVESPLLPPAEMPCSFAELAEFVEHGSLDSSRAMAVETFLASNFPEAIADRAKKEQRAREVAAAEPLRPRLRGESEQA